MPQKEIRARMLAIASGKIVPLKTDPKVWFASMTQLCRLLSDSNLSLLRTIRTLKPASISVLARAVNADGPSVKRRLRALTQVGLIELQGEGIDARPIVRVHTIQISIR